MYSGKTDHFIYAFSESLCELLQTIFILFFAIITEYDK